ncbi:unnamed protein product [Musa textilis]
MEPFAKVGLKGYWKRRGCHRLDGNRRSGAARTMARAGLGDRRRSFWRSRTPSLNMPSVIRAASPRRLLAGVRDAYLRVVLRFATSGGLGLGYGSVAVQPRVKEYDEKVIVAMYKAVVAHEKYAPSPSL